MSTMAESDQDMPIVGDRCPLCGYPLPDLWDGVLECETCGWQEWQPPEPWPLRSRGSAARAESPTTPRVASGPDLDQQEDRR